MAIAVPATEMNTETAVAVGKFVVIAYDAYDALGPDPTNLRPRVALPPNFDLVAWITMEDFVFKPGDERERRFYGFLAHETNTEHYVIAIRGTKGWREWWDDFHVLLVPFQPEGVDCGRAAHGFLEICGTLDVTYVSDETFASHADSLAAPGTLNGIAPLAKAAAVTAPLDFAGKVGAMVRVHQAERGRKAGRAVRAGDVNLSEVNITIAGHSLGSALATIFVLQNDVKPGASKLSPREVYTFASPAVGDTRFAARFNALGLDAWRIYNKPDLVPMLPPGVLGFVHVDRPYGIDTRTHPDIKWSIPCWHDMHSYLAVLGGAPLAADSGCHVATWPAAAANLLGDARHEARRALGLH